ncbi:hypothetical protein D8674_024937 [Pyrus ussuriensis x Pyrus communis]|uniref:Uncharacterized protein n=1 Tax=Pyrus ussuriensis x Pyrus communis TaxID=2448454 RepID=A0A5N5H4A2_9ROSA|nr:hypothetical protein D8674_024937 [Pyrus ussuriensis x Pyrus communis]
MSQLIRSRKAMTTALRSIPYPPTSATTALAEMDPKSVNLIDLVGPRVSRVPTSSASSVALLVSARRGHRRPCMPNTTSASTTDALGSQQGFGNCCNIRGDFAEILTNYNFGDINDNMLTYVNRLFAERYKSVLRRVARRSLRTRKKIGCSSAIIFRSPTICGVQNSQRLMSLQTFMGWGMPGSGNLEPLDFTVEGRRDCFDNRGG